MLKLMGRVKLPDDHPLRGYRRDAEQWALAQLARLAETAGGGEVGPAAHALVSSAALAHGTSRWLYDESALRLDAALAGSAARLAAEARAHLLAAHELCAREASARQAAEARARRELDPQAAMRARLGLTAAGSGLEGGGGQE